ncbi:MAG: metallophosphoesterase [Labilithrix sp.]|nr:metallophosphoesterase [Labilithrix sp.]
MKRHRVLPARGVLLVSTDVHGNLEDFARLEALFEASRVVEPETHWVILGDVVHAPDPVARRTSPALYDYEDGSMAIVDRILALEERAPGHVHFVLGNHDHGHVGGPHTQKFFTDEVTELESGLGAAQVERLRGLFRRALLAVAAPCGVLLTHGCPDATFERLADLEDVPLEISDMTDEQATMMQALLTSYGQPDHVTIPMLASVSWHSGLDLRVVIHGHDRDERGFFHEGSHSLCPTIFGAPRASKRYVRLDLGAHYESAAEIREDLEILRLHDLLPPS